MIKTKPDKEELEFQVVFYESIFEKDKTAVRIIEILAHLYTVTKRYKKGLEMDLLLVRHKPQDPVSHYNLACSFSLIKDSTSAIDSLEKAVNLGYDDFKWMSSDKDLDYLRKEPSFVKILLSIKKPEDPVF